MYRDDALKLKIPVEDLIIGEAYSVYARNIRIGIWDGKNFNGIREKFGEKFMDSETHWDLDDHYGTAIPIKMLK